MRPHRAETLLNKATTLLFLPTGTSLDSGYLCHVGVSLRKG
jgi:hypothetical protein